MRAFALGSAMDSELAAILNALQALESLEYKQTLQELLSLKRDLDPTF